jgi:hypothetical protein
MNRGVALIGALLVTLATPSTWPLALGAFLLRGGLLLVLLPIVVLPTPVGLATALGPIVTDVALGSVTPMIVITGGVALLIVLAWLLAGGWLAAALEAEAVRIVALDHGLSAGQDRPVGATGGRVAARVLAARLIAHVPFGLALAWGSIRVVSVAYRELTSPFDVATPIALRVLRATPEVIAVVVLAWMIGEIVGAVAARRIVLDREAVPQALAGALRTGLRQPLTTLGRFWGPTAVLVAIVILSGLAAATAWNAASDALDGPGDPLPTFVAVLGLVLVWVVALVVLGVACAWRTAVWTMAETAREGTFGGSTDTQPGDWRSEPTSATL